MREEDNMLVTTYDLRGRDGLFTKKPYTSSTKVFKKGDMLAPIDAPQDLVVISDPGKRSGATLIGDMYGTVFEVIIFSAYYSSKDIEETNDYCDDIEDFMLKYFKGRSIVSFCKEKTILERDKNASYISNKVLESIAKTLCDVARDLTGVNPEEINNWSWKSGVLPEGYRSNKEKGSHRWLTDVNLFNSALPHDITDAFCMYLYKIQNLGMQVICCNAVESPKHEANYIFMPIKDLPSESKVFKYSYDFSAEDNCSFYSNRSATLGAAKVDINRLQPREIINHCQGIYSLDEEVAILIFR